MSKLTKGATRLLTLLAAGGYVEQDVRANYALYEGSGAQPAGTNNLQRAAIIACERMRYIAPIHPDSPQVLTITPAGKAALAQAGKP